MSYKADGRIRKNVGASGVMKPPIRPKSNAASSRHVVARLCGGYVPVRTTFEQRLSACASDQPLQDSVEVGLFLRADTVAAHLAVRHGLQVQSVDELVYGKLVRKIGLVAEDQQGNALQRGLLQQELQLFTCYR